MNVKKLKVILYFWLPNWTMYKIYLAIFLYKGVIMAIENLPNMILAPLI
jgi:hypothetical protein